MSFALFGISNSHSVETRYQRLRCGLIDASNNAYLRLDLDVIRCDLDL